MYRFFDKQTLRVMRPYAMVISLCLFLCASVGMYVLHQLERSVAMSNESMNALVQSTVDRRLDELYRYSITLELNNANIMLKTENTMPQRIPAPVYRMYDAIRDFIDSNALAQGLYIYYPTLDFTVGSLGCFSQDAYRALQTIPYRESAGEWSDQLMQVDEPTFLWDQRPKEEESVLCYVRPQKIDRGRRAVMVVEISPEALIHAFSQAQEMFPEAFQLSILLNGKVIATEGNEVDASTVEEMFTQWNQQSDNTLTHGDTSVYFSRSTLSGLYFASFYNAGKTMHTVRTTVCICVVCAVFTLLLGFAGTLYVSSQNIRPIRNLLRRLGTQENDKADAYTLLTERVEQLIQTNQQSAQRIFEHQMLLDSNFFVTLLRGELRSESSVVMAANRYGVVFTEPVFQVLVAANESRTLPDEEGWQRTLYETLAAHKVEGLCTAFRGRLCILLNSDKPYSQQVLQDLCQDIMHLYYPEEPAAAGIGTCCDSLTAIITSYHCARWALLACTPDTTHPVCVYSPDFAQGHHGDARVMQDFCNLIYQKAYGQARTMLPQLYEEYLISGVVPGADLIRQQAVTSLLADAACGTLSDGEAVEITRALSTAPSPAEYRQRADVVLERLDKQENHSIAEKQKQPVAARAKQLIDESFTDPLMGLYLVSEQLNVSNSYLSTAFKNAYGVSLMQYLNRLRVEHAKKLILETPMSIKEIALASGFSSDINFIRVFKKQENKTPSMLRKKSAEIPDPV